MARHIWCWLWVVSLGWSVVLEAQTAPKPAEATPQRRTTALSGAIAGRVTDRAGAAQAQVSVTILRQDGHAVEKVDTQADGRFRVGSLPPGVYTAAVSQPAYLPYLKRAITVAPGAEVLLQINLFSLADSVEVGFPASLEEAAEAWKDVLRSGPARPILRLNEGLGEETQTASTQPLEDPRERALRGTVQFVAGNEARGFGQDPALRTAFDVAYELEHSQMLALAGSAGWERGTPAASLRGAWNRQTGDLGSSTLSTTVRQLFLPGEYWALRGDLPAVSDRRMQSFTIGYEEEKQLGEHARVQMGSLYDTVSFGGRMSRWSPFARVTIETSEQSRLTMAYTAATPRVLPSNWDPQRPTMDHWLAIPQLSSTGDGQPVLEGGQHIETQWEQQLGSAVRVQAAAFYDEISEAALSLAFVQRDETTATLLRDPFSSRYFASGGDYSSPGIRVAVATRLGPQSELIVGYGLAGTLEAAAPEQVLLLHTAGALRELIHDRMRQSFTVKLSSRLPLSHTHVITSYRWLRSGAVTISDPYDRGLGQADPYLNVYLLQPIPSPGIIPGQLEAVADFGNLLAEGYIPVSTAAGNNGTLFPTPRSFRGGFNFVF